MMVDARWLTEKIDSAVVAQEFRGMAGLAEFQSWIEPGDELRRFDNKQWMSMSGRAGYAIVRHGRVYASFVTRLN